MHRHAHTHAHTFKRAHLHERKYIGTQTSTCRYMFPHTNIITREYVNMHMLAHVCVDKNTFTYLQTYWFTHAHAHAHAYKNTFRRMHTQTNACPYTYSQMPQAHNSIPNITNP